MSQGRGYVLSGENLTLGTGDLLAVLASAAAGNPGSILGIERVEITQNANTSTAQSRIALGSRNASGTLTVSAATPNPLVLGGPASGLTGGTNGLTAAACGVNSSADSGGTYVNTYPCNPNNQGGYVWQPTEKNEIIVPPSTIFVVRFLAAPGTTTGWTVVVFFRELF
jgi:hypothetical protein